jgi:hypothetical protein
MVCENLRDLRAKNLPQIAQIDADFPWKRKHMKARMKNN